MAPRKPASAKTAISANNAKAVPRRSARFASLTPEVAAGPDTTTSRVIKKKAAKPKPRYDCATCDRSLTASSFPRSVPTETCTHRVTTCNACTKKHITIQLDSTTIDKLACPECPSILHNADVKRLGTKEAYARYDELERKAIAESHPGWRWCMNPLCREGQVHTSPVIKTLFTPSRTRRFALSPLRQKPVDDICICHACGTRACVPCDRPFHDGESCKQYHARKKQEIAASEKAIAKNCKKCPTCGKNIEKDGGCDMMQCTQCNTSFCWICRTDYKVIDTKGHPPRCRYARTGAIDVHAAPNAPGGIDQLH